MSDGLTPTFWAAFGTLLLSGILAIVSGVVWHNKEIAKEREYSKVEREKQSSNIDGKVSDMKKELDQKVRSIYTTMNKNKESCADIDKRVGILEVEHGATKDKLSEISTKVDTVERSLIEMKLENKEYQMNVMDMLHKIDKKGG